MRRSLLLTCLMSAALLLTACGGQSPQASGTANNSANGFRSSTGRIGNLSPEAKLALGTIKLEGTKEAVNPEMAAKLIPLWQLLAQLDSSTSSAPQEVTAVLDQINTTMAPEQLKAISGMPLSAADIFTILQQDSQSSGAGGTSSGGTSQLGRNRGGGGFVFVEGGPGGAPGGFGGEGFRNNGGTSTGITSQASAAQAAQATQAREKAISTLVINQLVRLLETKLSK